jgi:uncharacterized membrane protein
MSIAITLHLLSVVVWVGGMFFAYMALRPVAAALLEPPVRVTLWRDSFKRFFPWVWAAVILLPLSGYWIIFAHMGGMGGARPYVHIMNTLGFVMIALYLYVYFVPFAGMKRAIESKDIPEAGRRLARIRQVIGINLALGLIVIVVAGGGKYLV